MINSPLPCCEKCQKAGPTTFKISLSWHGGTFYEKFHISKKIIEWIFFPALDFPPMLPLTNLLSKKSWKHAQNRWIQTHGITGWFLELYKSFDFNIAFKGCAYYILGVKLQIWMLVYNLEIKFSSKGVHSREWPNT